MNRIEQRVSSFEFRVKRCVHGSRLATRNSRLGITLIEILISMFVLLFGLMGVAAIFPVASHYIVEGEKRDRGGGLAQIAFEELKSRKLLRPKTWLYETQTRNGASGNSAYSFITPMSPYPFFFAPNQVGNAFVIDPLAGGTLDSKGAERQFFPRFISPPATPPNPWQNSNPGSAYRADNAFGWPVRRLTLDVDANPLQVSAIQAQAADTTFRLRDDLAVQQPEAGDRPSIQTWSQSGGQLLSRQYTGDYSWLATVVPTRLRALEALQPFANIKDEFYEVTAVVFYKRDTVPSASAPGSPGSERLIAAEFMNSGELAIYQDPMNPGVDTVDTAVDGIKPTNWIAVMGVHQTTGTFLMKWYKILALDDSTDEVVLNNGSTVQGRYVMVQGPDWPETRTPAGPTGWVNLRVAILPGAIDAYTRVMQIEQE